MNPPRSLQVTLSKLVLGATLLAVVGSAGATETLEALSLPVVTKAPWRFTEFPLLAWWAPPGSEPAPAFEDYRDAGFNIYPLNPDKHFEDGLVKAADAGLSIMP